MKKLLTSITLLLIINVNAQNWKFESGKSDFDGKYKTSYVIGKGNNFPYNKPMLTINKFDKNENLNFYISGAGYFQEGTNAGIKFVFDNEPNVIYSSYSFTFSSDGKIIFFDTFNDPNSSFKISKYEFLEKLKKASKLSIRTSDKYGSNDIVFSLTGSTKAINFIIPEKEINDKITLIENLRIKETEKEKLINEKVAKIVEIAKKEKMGETYLSILKSKIEKEYKNGKSYKTINIKPTRKKSMFETYGYVDVYGVLENGEEEEIYGTYKVEMNSPIFAKIEEEKQLKAEKEKIEKDRIYSLLEKYKINELKDFILEKIIEEQKRTYLKKWKLNEVKNVNAIFSEYKYGKVWNLKIIINLENGEKIDKDEYIYSLKITKKQLKGIGAKLLEEF
ncbi:hypothetical protein [Polaribacter marinivivus]|uniref:Uncharacterized protein n=1 Tax=Polaribacter marinivivus TaxID=1524260 RepID=A0ABV8R9W4_9FLAO|nr:hypothetical protein [uncultured Formosa sp.]